jgi:glycosyltransferase involved in cell wall biosynthesis
LVGSGSREFFTAKAQKRRVIRHPIDRSGNVRPGLRIGVVIPAFNAACWISDAIRSVLAQRFLRWTLVVVDDGSTDATGALVAGFADPRIRLIRQDNAGVSAARNRGLAALECDAALFLDADDWLAPHALGALGNALLAAPRAVAASGAFALGAAAPRLPPSGDLLPKLLFQNQFANGGHVLLRLDAARAVGGFRCDLAYGEDWEYWVRLALRGHFATTAAKDALLYVRQHDTGTYRRLATEPSAFGPCIAAIFGNSALTARFGPLRLAALQRRAEAENAWIIGRELIRHGDHATGRAWLRRSVMAAPGAKRAALLAAAHALAKLPSTLHGPFLSYTERDSEVVER